MSINTYKQLKQLKTLYTILNSTGLTEAVRLILAELGHSDINPQ